MGAVQEIDVPSARFGTYRVKQRLGQGGMAEVFLAEAVDEKGDQLTAALKLMRKGGDEVGFLEEADLMGLLVHRNLVRRLEVGTAFGRPFIAMEYLIGGDLRGVMEQRRQEGGGVPLDVALHVLMELLRGLAYFHGAKTRSGQALNLVHSDVNPANVFFDSTGVVKLGDFGVAMSTHTGLSLQDGVAAGKLGYLSPEQARGEKATPQSDLWSVGVMLHELVAGGHPFQREGMSEEQVLAAVRAAKVVVSSAIDKPLGAVVAKALAADPKHRYRTAGELAGALYGYAVDRDLVRQTDFVADWLQGALELVV